MIKKSTAWLLVVVMILGLYVPGQVFALEGLGTVPAVESNLNGADPAQIAAPIQRVLTKTPYQFDQVATSVYGALGFKSTADTNGELWTWGERSNEWTGSDTEDNRDVPRLLKTNVRQFSAGGSFVVAVTNDSKLLYWGHNWKGENGNQATPDADAQLGIEIMTDVKMASAGDGYLMVLKNDDTLWTAGSNNYGQLGDGDQLVRTGFKKVMTDIKYVAAGRKTAFVIKNNHDLIGWGSNRLGILKPPTNISSDDREAVELTPQLIMADCKFVAEGIEHTGVAIGNDNFAYGWGWSGNGVFPDLRDHIASVPIKLVDFPVKHVSTSYWSALAVLGQNGDLYTWGENRSYQLGHTLAAPDAPSTSTTFADRKLIASNVTTMAMGEESFLVVTSDGTPQGANTLYGVGSNRSGVLGFPLPPTLYHKRISGTIKLPVGYPINHPDIKVQVRTEASTNNMNMSATFVIPAGESEVDFELKSQSEGLATFKLSVKPDNMIGGFYCERNAITNRALLFEDADLIQVTDDVPLVLKPITLEASEQVSFTVDNPNNAQGNWINFSAFEYDAEKPNDSPTFIGGENISVNDVNQLNKVSVLNLLVGSKNFAIMMRTENNNTHMEQFLKKIGSTYSLTANRKEATLFANTAELNGFHIDMTPFDVQLKSISGTIKLPVGYPTDHKDIRVTVQTEEPSNGLNASVSVVIPAGESEVNYELKNPSDGLTSFKLSVRPDALMWGYYSQKNASTNRTLSWSDADLIQVTDDAPLVLQPITLEQSEAIPFTVGNPNSVSGHWLAILAHEYDIAKPEDEGRFVGDTGLIFNELNQVGIASVLNLTVGAKNLVVRFEVEKNGLWTQQYLKKTGNAFTLTSNKKEATLFANATELSGFHVDLTPYLAQQKRISGTLRLPENYPATHPAIEVRMEFWPNGNRPVNETVVIPADQNKADYSVTIPTDGVRDFNISLRPEKMMWSYYNTAKTDTNQSILWEDRTFVKVDDNEPLTLNTIILEASDQVSFTISNLENLKGNWLGIYADVYSLTSSNAPSIAAGAIEMPFDDLNQANKTFIFNLAVGAKNFLMPVCTSTDGIQTWQYVVKVGSKFVLTSNIKEATYFADASALTGMHLALKAYAPPAIATTVEINGPSTVESSLTDFSGATYSALVKDQNGSTVPNMAVVYSLKNPVTGISINDVTGLVTIEKTVVAGVSFTVVATVQDINGVAVKAEKSVTVTKQQPSAANNLEAIIVNAINAPTVNLVPGANGTQQTYQVDGLKAEQVLEISYVPAQYASAVFKINGAVVQTIPTNGPALPPGIVAMTKHSLTLKQGITNVTIEVTSQSGLKKIYAIDLIVPIPNDGKPVTIGTGDNQVVKIPADLKATDTVEIKIDPAVKDAKIQLGAPIENATSKEVQIAGALNFKTNTGVAAGAPSISVDMPAGIKISTSKSNVWDGTIGLPSITQTSGSTAVEVGLPGIALYFDKPVKIVLPGMAGKKAQWSRGGTVQEITTVLSANTPEVAASALVGGIQEAKIDVGQDMVIWTMHFTEFKAYTPAPPLDNGSSTSGNTSGNTGGTTGGNTGGNTGGSTDSTPIQTVTPVIPVIPVTPTVPVIPVAPVKPVIGTIVANPGDVVVPLSNGTFTDLKVVAWAQEAINYLTAKGIITINPSKQFNPNGKLTRAEFATMIVRHLKLTTANNQVTRPVFKDVKATDWFAKDVEIAAAAGLIKGVNSSNDRFNPNGLITRQEIAAVMGRILVKNGVKLDKNPSQDLFKAMKDNNLIAAWAQDGAKLVVQEGIITGRMMSNQKISLFVPQETATRAEFAVMLYRLAKR